MNGAAALVPAAGQEAGTASIEQWQLMREQAAIFIKSGLLPSHIKSPEQAVVIMLAKVGRLGLPALYALSTIGIINGKPVGGRRGDGLAGLSSPRRRRAEGGADQ